MKGDNPRLSKEEMVPKVVEAFMKGENPMTAIGYTTIHMEEALYDVKVYQIVVEAGFEFLDWDEAETEMMRRQQLRLNKVEAAMQDFLDQNMQSILEHGGHDGT